MSDPTKPGIKTTEFWMAATTVAAMVIGMMSLPETEPWARFASGAVIVVVFVAYTWARVKVKGKAIDAGDFLRELAAFKHDVLHGDFDINDGLDDAAAGKEGDDDAE